MSTRLTIVGVLYRLVLAAFLLPAAVPAQETTGSLSPGIARDAATRQSS